MKRIFAALLMVALMVGAAWGAEVKAPTLAQFEAGLMKNFGSDQIKTSSPYNGRQVFTLEEGLSSTVIVQADTQGAVKKININFNGRNAPRYMKAVRNTINTVFAGHSDRASIEKMFYEADPKNIATIVDNVCVERTAHPQLGWILFVTFHDSSENITCPSFKP